MQSRGHRARAGQTSPPSPLGALFLPPLAKQSRGTFSPYLRVWPILCIQFVALSCALHSLLYTLFPCHSERHLLTCFTDELFSVLPRADVLPLPLGSLRSNL